MVEIFSGTYAEVFTLVNYLIRMFNILNHNYKQIAIECC